MATFSVTKQVDAPVERVFDVFTDLRNAANRISAIKKLEVLTDGPVRAGTRFRETRVVFGKEATEEMEISAFEPNRRYEVSCESCGARFRFGFTFEPRDGGTLVTMTGSTQAVSFFAKLMSPLSGMMMKQCRKAGDQDMEDLKRAIESGV